MQLQQPAGAGRADVDPLLVEDRGQPERLASGLDLFDVRFAPARVEDHEPDQPGSHDEPDDEQPPVELGIHRGEV
jgi:hypothetical protein